MWVIGVILTGMISTAGADSITIQKPNEVIDSFLLGLTSSTSTAINYGYRPTVDVNGSINGYNRTGVFHWNLDNIPIAGNMITNVKIMLYVDNYPSTNSRSYTLRQITGGDWVESEVTAIERKTGIDWINQSAQPWGDLSTVTYGTLDIDTENIWITFSSDDNPALLTLVQNMVDGTVRNDGFSVLGPNSSVVADFRSVNHGTASTRPKMVINYVPDPKAQTVTIQGPDDVIDSFLLGDGNTPNPALYGDRTTVDINNYSGYNRTGIFRWNLDNVSSTVSGNKMIKVEIMLYVNTHDTTSRDYDLRQITGGNWVESEVSAVNISTNPVVTMWTNQSAHPWGDLSTKTYGTLSINARNIWVTFSSDDDLNLLTLVQSMIDGTVSNYGFSVEGPSISALVDFRSTDYTTDPSTQPKMVITYIPIGILIIIN